ncbi:MAG: carbohydrate-binding domain-containing protein [Clostridia bacterium]|nr:carbohydrate-binding domain-containing protein [Clostridia bacterium]
MKKKLLKAVSLSLAMMMITASAISAFAVDCYTGTFVISGGDASITVYDTQDYTSGYTATSAYSRDDDTGEITTDGGQINFTVVPADGYSVSAVTVEGSYKNLKDSSDTGKDNTWRITKVASDLTITVTLEESGETEAETGDPVVTFTETGASVSGSSTGVSVDGTDVKITGPGTYKFTGSCSDGTITVKKNVADVILILDGLTLGASATAPITCNKGSSVTIYAAKDSVNNLSDDKYNNDDIYTDTSLYPDIENAVIKCKDGSNVTICGEGTINITANGKNGIKGGYDLYDEIENEDGTTTATDTLLSTASLTIKDVTLNIKANVNDGLKSDKELNILSGIITVSSADDGIKSDYILNIGAEGTTGPEINITDSAEGIEGATVNIYSGNIRVNATDDGINAANSDLTDYGFSYNQYGGYVYVSVSNGDGIDSNGSISFAGGRAEIYSPSQGDGDPIDADSGVNFSGGTVLGIGNNAMQQSYGGTYVEFGQGTGGMGMRSSTLVTSGKTVKILDNSGNELYTATSVRDAGYAVFASPDLTSGSTYKLSVNGSTVKSASAVTGSVTAGRGSQNGSNMTPPSGNMPAIPSENPNGFTPPSSTDEQSADANSSSTAGGNQTQDETYGSDNSVCVYCSQVHTGTFGKVISFFHYILYFFSNFISRFSA